MANNRMYLVHRPSGLGIMLGKRMSWGWYRTPEEDHFQKFYDYLSNVWLVENKADQDDFVVIQEESNDWRYKGMTEEGFAQFEVPSE